jgi:adenine phosphoribosyltransferase
MPANTLDDFYAAIHDVPDFPTPGVLFRDITPLLGDSALFGSALAQMADPFRGAGVTKVLGIESRGFILGGPISLDLDAGLVPARKEGKLPRARHRVEYTLEYGTAALEVHSDGLGPDDRVLIVDDVLATGGTAQAARDAVSAAGGTVVGFSFLIEIAPLGGRSKLGTGPIETLLVYPRPV